jgi:hypothetical protein
MLQGRKNKSDDMDKIGVWKLKRCTMEARRDQCIPMLKQKMPPYNYRMESNITKHIKEHRLATNISFI